MIKNNNIKRVAFLAIICFFPLSISANNEGNVEVSPYYQNNFENKIVLLNIKNKEKIKVNKIENGINYSGKELIEKKSNQNFNINFDLYKNKKGFYLIRNGFYENDYGFLKFEFNIKKEELSSSSDFIDLLFKSSYLLVESYSDSNRNFFTFLDNKSTFQENYKILKRENKINVLYFDLNIENKVNYNFKGDIGLIGDKIMVENGYYKINNKNNVVSGEWLNSYVSRIMEDVFLKINK